MDRRILDLISTKYVSKKIEIEMELEKLINNPPAELTIKELSDKIMNQVSNLKDIVTNTQSWESIVSQLTLPPNPEDGNNNK
jgi:hypothetical protein